MWKLGIVTGHSTHFFNKLTSGLKPFSNQAGVNPVLGQVFLINMLILFLLLAVMLLPLHTVRQEKKQDTRLISFLLTLKDL